MVLDGSDSTRALAHRLLRSGHRVAILSSSPHEIVEFTSARFAGHAWPVIARPEDPSQVNDALIRAAAVLGPIGMVVDPSGRIADIARADARIGI